MHGARSPIALRTEYIMGLEGKMTKLSSKLKSSGAISRIVLCISINRLAFAYLGGSSGLMA